MIRFLMLLLAFAGPAGAETARVYSGEHDDFTRLVVELPAGGDWTLGRTPTGYAFAFGAGAQPVYDTSGVWDRIPRTRLQTLRTDPETGALQLSLACACHVFPFEYQPGIVVLDIKPGPAPEGSAFETSLVPGRAEGQAPETASAPAPVYDWLHSGRPAKEPAAATGAIALPSGETSLDPLRMALLEQISRGAAQGVVDMVLPGKPPEIEPMDHATLLWSRIHIGPPEDVLITATAGSKESMTPEGEACIKDAELALPDWGAGRSPRDLLAEARSRLYGEFDALDTEATLHSVRAHLYLGFGAEAAQYARLLSGPDAPDDAAMLQSLALLVEGAHDPNSPFLAMLGCEGAAALWAALAFDDLPAGEAVNSDAIVRSFMALPPHLRGTLGADLAEKLLVYGDDEAARIIRNAFERTPDVSPAAVAGLDATAELNGGEPAAAIEHAAAAISEDGSSVAGWIALVEAHFRKVEPIAADSAAALRAFQGEIEGSELAPEYFRALALAELLSGQTAVGFRTAETWGVPLSDLWHVATTLAEDDAFVLQALAGQPAKNAPEVATGVAIGVATGVGQRLVDLGFPDAGLAWLGPTGPDDSLDRRRIAAKAEIARGNARQTLALVAGLSEPGDLALKAQAMVQLDQIAGAREVLTEAGLEDEALRLASWEGAWPELQSAEAPLWASAVAEANREAPKEAGPLARGAAILAASAASRGTIDALLAGVAGPVP